ncbi:glycosyltransferase family 4 protein [Bacteroides caecigallinarum]|nr:glycosyltransferase family 4 protein [Bacteroides caecigallinarum]
MEKIISEKANAFSEEGHNVYIITADQKNRKAFYRLNNNIKLIDLGINYSEDITILAKLIKYKYKIEKHKRRLSNILYEIRPDITISTMGNEFLFLYKIKDGSKKILEIHFAKGYRMMYNRNIFWKFFDYIRSLQESKLVSKYDKFVVLTYEDKVQWGNLTNIEVIPNFIDLEENYHSIKNKTHILLAVGRLSYQKGFDRLIKAISLISDKLKDWEVHIYGDGELKKDLQSMINDYNLNKYIKIFPATKDIKSVYMTSSGFILSSRFEGLPMVLLEALSYSLPIISFDCPCGPKDIINDGVNGILIKNDNIEELASAILDYIHNPELREKLSIEAYNSVFRFKKNNVINKWLVFFEKEISTTSFQSN